MAIQINGMNTELLLLKTQLEKKVPFSERMVGGFQRVIEKSNKIPYSESPVTKVREAILGAKAFGYGFAAVAADTLETKARKKNLMAATGVSADNIAMDVNELAELRNNRKPVRVYGDNLRFGANIQKEWLVPVETIFGDADLQALDDFSCLASLKAIYGDLNLSQVENSKVDLSGLHIQMVYGDIHAEQAISTAGLEDLLIVGGTIFYQGKTYNLNTFQEMIANNEKERQM